jgi:hypothetical protein
MQTKLKLITLYAVLKEASKIGGAKFRYAVLKNLKSIDSEIESLKTIEKDIEEIIKDFNEAKNIIIMEHGTPDEKGIHVVKPGDENFELVNKKIKDLVKTHETSLDLYRLKREEYEKLLKEDAEFDFNLFEINIDNIPDELKDLEILMDFEIVK